MEARKINKKSGLGRRNRNRLIFYIIGVSLPILQFCIFYIGVNFNSILLAFQSFNKLSGKFSYVGWDNFRWIASEFSKNDTLWNAVGRSFIAYVFSLLEMAVSLIFSFYIYKKAIGAKFFRTILFLPKIIPGVVFIAIFSVMATDLVPQWFPDFRYGWIKIQPPEKRFWTVLVYTLFTGFGMQTLLFGSTMSSISESIVEAAQLDGITPVKEFCFITVPMIFPTISTFILVGVAGIFTNQVNIFSFYGASADSGMWTFGYYLFAETQSAGTYGFDKLPRLAAIGLCLTFVTVPVMMAMRKTLDKVGPKTE